MTAFILSGEDHFRRELKLKALRSEHIQEGMEALSLVELDNPSIAELASNIGSASFALGSKLVIVRNFKPLSTKAEDEQVEAILETIKTKPDTTIVVFNETKVLGTLKLVKAIKKLTNTEFEDFKAFTPWDIQRASRWMSDHAKTSGLGIPSYDVIDFFVEYLGSEDSANLASEYQRLVTLTGDAKQITNELIQQECKPKHDIFALARELASANKEKAIIELNKLIRADELNIGSLAAIETSVTRYLKLKLLTEQRASKDELATALGVSPGRVYHMQREVNNMPKQQLEKVSSGLLEIERKVKTGKQSLDLALKLLVLN